MLCGTIEPMTFLVFFCLNYNNTLEDQSDDKSKFIRSIPNQDGNLITIGHCYCIVEDKEGSIWIGTDKGPLILNNPSRIFNDNFYCTQIKIPRMMEVILLISYWLMIISLLFV